MKSALANTWIHRLAVFTAFGTLCLIGLGGLVTSKEAGLAVPDWPTSYDYNMFFLPVSHWVGNIFYEHTHRLLASVIGLLTAGLAAWIWTSESTGKPKRAGLIFIFAALLLMGVRTQGMFIVMASVAICVLIYCLFKLANSRDRLRWWAMIAFCAVLVQGVLGGMRVTLAENQIGILHGVLAQSYFVLICAIAVWTSKWWQNAKRENPAEQTFSLKWVYALATAIIFTQLFLGASMRHQHAGLAVPDFPAAYGKWWPDTNPEALERYNQKRTLAINWRDRTPVTKNQIYLHMAHRTMAILVVAVLVYALIRTRRELPKNHCLRKYAWGWIVLVSAQVLLGVLTVLKNKPADIATLHVLLGALLLALGSTMLLVAQRTLPLSNKIAAERESVDLPVPAMN